MTVQEKVYWGAVGALVVLAFVLMTRGFITNDGHFQSSDLNRDGVVNLTDLSIMMANLHIDNISCIPTS